MSLLTCKQFLQDLSEYLDDAVGPELRAKLEEHAGHCRDCRVIVDTTRKTLVVYKGAEPMPVPQYLHERLMAALQRKMASKTKPA